MKKAALPLRRKIGDWLFRQIQKQYIKQLYQAFRVYPCPTTLVTVPPCSIDGDLDRILTTTPLAAIEQSQLTALLRAAAVGECAPDLRYYLPRFFEVLFITEGAGLEYAELLCDYVSYEYGNFSSAERALIEQLLYVLISREFSLPEDECDEMIIFAVALTPYNCLSFLRREYVETVNRALKKDPDSLGKITTVKDRLRTQVEAYRSTMSESEFETWSRRGSRQQILDFIGYTGKDQELVMSDLDFVVNVMRALGLQQDAFSAVTLPYDFAVGKDEVLVTSTLCAGWSLRYNLFNPENFEDPSTVGDWYDPKDLFEYYETPYADPTKLTITKVSEDATQRRQVAQASSLSTLESFITRQAEREEELLAFFLGYTFGNGGTYADGRHFGYAMATIGTLRGVSYTPESFIKELVQLRTFILVGEPDTCRLYFDVAWDLEHGLCVQYQAGQFTAWLQ
jgi:hypothetical protein